MWLPSLVALALASSSCALISAARDEEEQPDAAILTDADPNAPDAAPRLDAQPLNPALFGTYSLSFTPQDSGGDSCTDVVVQTDQLVVTATMLTYVSTTCEDRNFETAFAVADMDTIDVTAGVTLISCTGVFEELLGDHSIDLSGDSISGEVMTNRLEPPTPNVCTGHYTFEGIRQQTAAP